MSNESGRLPTSTPPSEAKLALLLAALAMLGPFSIDAYLPAFPSIEQSLSASAIQVQQTLTAYMAAFAVMILWHGALSDAFGRRSIILLSLAVYAIASIGCAAVHSIEYFWVFRMLQGVSAGAGVVIGRAIVRDLYSGSEAARMLSLVTMIFSVSPAIAPIVGGWVVAVSVWRTLFLLLFAFTLLMLWQCWHNLPETLPIDQRQRFHPESLWKNYRKIFSSRMFQLKAAAIACNFSGLFLYVASAPAIITRHLGLGPTEFSWLFVPSVVGIFLGALAANRMAGSSSTQRQILIGFIFLMTSCLINVGYHALLPPALPWTVAPLFLYTIGMSMVAPGLTLLILDLFPAIRGTVASCQSFTMTMLSAVVAGLLAPMLSDSVLNLAIGQMVLVLTGFALWRLVLLIQPSSGLQT
ncbi:MAG: multidrug effflux MFS transporter [Oxalobacteraceae bacterium]|jgi:DHA1 family bicyclomycin/chloramphenicol resistance-like MFS transporter|nr:multidrug effflux MFS transporter [Oxalobacteraceae bacterium]